ncbi:RNA polymerase sigma factor [Nannocystaceae bacterium ST9]
MATDLDLLERWRAGDRNAGNELAARYFPDLRTYFVLRLPSEHEDLVQETFSQLLKGLGNFRGEASFRTYLFRIARNLAAAAFRKRYRAQFDPISDSLVDLTGERQSSVLAERETWRLLLDSLRALSIDDQDLLELYFFQRLTARELGSLFGASEGAIRNRIRTTLQRLRTTYFELAARPHERDIDERQLGRWMLELRESLRQG